METLEERIRSRFEWGLMADIGAPDYETRMAILRRKVESDDMSLSDDILNYIANNIKSNIRELEGALNKLLAYSNLEKQRSPWRLPRKNFRILSHRTSQEKSLLSLSLKLFRNISRFHWIR